MKETQNTPIDELDRFKRRGIELIGYDPFLWSKEAAAETSYPNDLGGFDERYGEGSSYDDDEFLHRVKLLGLNLKIVHDVIGIHQWHYSNENRNMEFYNRELRNQN